MERILEEEELSDMAQGPLENMEAFAQDFNCADGSAMNPTEKCQVSLVFLFQTIATCQQTFSALVPFSILVFSPPWSCPCLIVWFDWSQQLKKTETVKMQVW